MKVRMATTAVLIAGLGLVAQAGAGAEPGTIRVAIGGDMIGPFVPVPPASDPGFEQVAALFRGSDAGIANQEGSIFDIKAFDGAPAAENGGGYPLSPIATAALIERTGIRLVSKANNHATDWGIPGLNATQAALKAAGIVSAGAGEGIAAARGPAYLQTRAGVVAMVSAAATFPPMAAARPDIKLRNGDLRSVPGINAVQVRHVTAVSGAGLAALRAAAGSTAYAQGDSVRIGDEVFEQSTTPGQRMEMNPVDAQAVVDAVRSARDKAKLVVFALHAHQTAVYDDAYPPADYEPLLLHRANEAPGGDDPRPAAFVQPLARAAIDAGADLVMRTGPHRAGGIEIYRGKPIFYSLGSLVFSFGGRRSYRTLDGQLMNFPAEWFESIVPLGTYRDGRLVELRLYPIVLQSSATATDGLPRLAPPAQGKAILQRVGLESAPYGTRIVIKAGVGFVTL